MPHDDLDVKFEKALAGHLRGRSEKTRSCMDAETLAAYQDGVLPEQELSQTKEHIVRCDRCQEILALSAEPRPAVAVMPARRRHAAQWRWFAPVGAIAAALVLWIATHNRKSVPAFDLAKNQSQTEPAARSESPVAAERHADQTRSNTPVGPDWAATSKREAKTLKQTESSTAAGTAAATAAAPVPKTADRRDAEASSDAVSSLQAVVPRYSPAPAAPSISASAGPARETASSNISVTGSSSPVVTAETAGARTLQKAKKDDVHPVQIPSPVTKVLWRVAAGGLIQRSTDSGSTWTIQTSGVVVDLLSSSAPSETVCWVVGRSGTILRTTDAGQHWQKIESPVNAEISGVFAVSEQQATVTLAGHSYQTSDGGQTWAILPGSSSP